MTTIAFAVALALIVAGVAFVYWPASLIVAGGLLGGSAWLYDAGSDEDPDANA